MDNLRQVCRRLTNCDSGKQLLKAIRGSNGEDGVPYIQVNQQRLFDELRVPVHVPQLIAYR